MARLLVVSRSMALAMRIADDHDVIEYPVEALEDLSPEPDVDAVVLDLGEPHAAVQTLDRLRSHGSDTRVLIVSGYQPAWNDLMPLSTDRVVVVPLPITRAALLDGIDRLLGVTPFVPRVPPGASSPPAGFPRATPPGGAPSRLSQVHPPGTSPAARPGVRTNSDGLAPALPVRPVPTGSRGPGSAPARPAAPAPAAAPAARSGTPDPGTRPDPGAPPVHPPGPGRAPEPAGSPVTGTAGGTRRPGLARWLTTSPPPRPAGAAPQGSPLDAGSATRQSSSGASAAAPAGAPADAPSDAPEGAPEGAPASGPEEGNLFRPVVEPHVPLRSRGTLPARPQRPAPTPPPAAPAPAPSQVRPVAAPQPAASPAPARPASVRPAPTVLPTSPAARAVPPPEAPAAPAANPVAPAAAAAAAAAPAPAPAAAPEAPDRPARGLGRGVRGRGRDPRTQHPGFTPAAGLQAAPAPAPVDPVTAAVASLLDHRSELFGVAETAQVLADEVIERGEADAAAVLVPDGGRWRVSGGVGLRPLERRLLLDTSHWLIAEIAIGGRALLIEDTDIVRPRLAGAPLAAWRHLLAVPVPSLRAAVVLARGQEAERFTEKDLAAVVPLVTEAKPLLQAALRMRELARTLGPLRDLEG